jgi:hypothetical protein
MKTRSSNDEIRQRVSVSGFPSFLDEQAPLGGYCLLSQGVLTAFISEGLVRRTITDQTGRAQTRRSASA